MRRDNDPNRPQPQYDENGRPIPPQRRPMGPPNDFFPEHDPEMHELMQKDQELEHQTVELSRNVREASGEQKQQALMMLSKAVEDHFKVRQARRTLQIKRLTEEIERIKDQVEAREKSKADIIRRRLQELTGEDGALGF
jgi:hypothetical protein